MPAHGATSAKVGQRYEDRWTAHSVLNVLKGGAEWVYLERIETDETGFEFELGVNGSVEHHQVKRQISGDSGWRLRDLASVLKAFRGKLEDPGAICVFASGNSAQVLKDLATDVANAEDYATFQRALLSVAARRSQFKELADMWATEDAWVFSSCPRNMRTPA